MSTAILVCTSLIDYIQEAQRSQGRDYPVISVDKSYHKEPELMKQKIVEIIDSLEPEIDTVLVAMGFCGGSWDHMKFSRRVVIPRVDDCVSLLLHTDDAYHPNLKEFGHLYLYEKDPDSFSKDRIMDGQVSAEYGGLDSDTLFHMFFDNYRYLDIVDTGLNDCYTEEYVEKAQANADAFQAVLDYVPGSNRLLEKLVSGRWDEQFLVVEPGHRIQHSDFFA